ncbi:MAG: hypothetical protein MJ065_08790 [Oscillospiraceae bacterium]|nr:hypothetical protein [Oscillospiraceae bacterium]
MNYYVDMHTNILPELAGLGQRALTAAEIPARLDALRKSNMKIAAASPYFDSDKYEPAAFIAMRDQKIAALSDASSPLRIVGSAVVPFEYCCKNPRTLRQFAIGSSDYILVDLPRVPLTEEFCDSISRLHIVSGLCPVAADIDRHYTLWSPEELIALQKRGILLQISTDGLLHQEFRKLSLFLLANQHAHFIASGGRSISEPLHFIEAMRIVQRSLPAQLYRRIKSNAGMLLSNAEPSTFIEE